MKKVLTICVASLLSILVLAQEKKLMRLDLTDGTSLTGQGQIQQDGSYLLETAGGDIFFFNPSEVRKVTILSGQESKSVPSVSSADNGYKTVFKKGGKLRFSSTGLPLAQTDFNSYRDWKKYKGARGLRTTGTVFMISSVGVGLGCFFSVAYSTEYLTDRYDGNGDWITYYQPGWSNGAWFAIGGFGVTFIPGLIMNICGNAQLKKMEKNFNNTPGYVIDFGAQKHGIGLALNF